MNYKLDDLIDLIARHDEHEAYYRVQLYEFLAAIWDAGFDEASDDLGRAQSMAEHGEDLNPFREQA